MSGSRPYRLTDVTAEEVHYMSPGGFVTFVVETENYLEPLHEASDANEKVRMILEKAGVKIDPDWALLDYRESVMQGGGFREYEATYAVSDDARFKSMFQTGDTTENEEDPVEASECENCDESVEADAEERIEEEDKTYCGIMCYNEDQ